jgi:DNA-binding TFAR19-related protein (PDSD5 family)
MSDYDPELEIIKARKLRELRKKAASEKKVKTDRDVLLEHLVDRGDEVLAAAEARYPRETAIIVSKLVEFIKSGELQGTISGGALLSLFRSIGLPVRMETKIQVEEHGKLISLSERLRSGD